MRNNLVVMMMCLFPAFAGAGAAGESSSEKPETLSLANSPVPEQLSGKWSRAKLIYGSDFEQAMEGAFPRRWQSYLSTSYKGNPNNFMRVRPTDSGG